MDQWLEDHPLVTEHETTSRNTGALGGPGDYLCGARTLNRTDARQLADDFREYGAEARLGNYRFHVSWPDGDGTTYVSLRRDFDEEPAWRMAGTPMPKHVISRGYGADTRLTTEQGKVPDVAVMALELGAGPEQLFRISDGDTAMRGKAASLVRRAEAVLKLRAAGIEATSPEHNVKVLQKDLERAEQILGDDFPDVPLTTRGA